MPSLQSLSMRLKAVTSTAKITKAMKMVAASKLGRAQKKLDMARPFAAGIQSVMGPVLAPTEDDTIESELIFAISSDKGLCGGINSRVVKELKLQLDAAETAPTLMICGGKVRDGLQRTHASAMSTTFDEAYNMPITFSLASFLGESILEHSVDKYTIYYNKFISVIAFDVTPMTIKGPECLGASGVMDEYEFEGEKENILADLYQYNLALSLYGCLLENNTSEQASRMTAMDAASNNAKDMIDRLRLQFNRQRQAVITTELTEIVAGAESV